MSFLSRLFGAGYDDTRLMSLAETTVAEDPLVVDPTLLTVASEGGVLTLGGSVQRTLEKDHIETAVQNTIQSSGLKFERIVSQIQIK